MMREPWLIPSFVLTAALAGIALAIMPNHSGVMPALGLLPLWLIISAVLGAFYAYFRMVALRVKSPVVHIAHCLRHGWLDLVVIAMGISLAGLNMCAFMWTKPLLNFFVPFWADPYLARFDRLLFFGNDPWTLLSRLNGFGTALFYHRAWFAMMIVTLLVVLSTPASPRKSAVMLTYFLLWSVAGPVIHTLLPAAGPVFYDRLGYGDAFAGIPVPEEMTQMSDYLWTTYTQGQFGPGSGISAMPSLHIATTAWMVIAIHALARRWTWTVAVPGLLIFLLSISLGWHYAVDGIVGAAAALGCYRASLRYFASKSTSPEHLIAQPAPASL